MMKYENGYLSAPTVNEIRLVIYSWFGDIDASAYSKMGLYEFVNLDQSLNQIIVTVKRSASLMKLMSISDGFLLVLAKKNFSSITLIGNSK